MPLLRPLHLEDRLPEAAQAPVCALVGGDDPVASYCLALLKAAAAPAALPGATVRHFEDVPAPYQVFDELRTVPFMGLEGRRVVVVEDGDAFLAAHWEALADYMERPSRTGTLFIRLTRLDPKGPPRSRADEAEAAQTEAPQESRRADKKPDERDEGRMRRWRALVKALGAEGFIIECRAPSWREAKQWVRSQAERMGTRLTPRAVDSLLEALGPNVIALRTELEKLAVHAGAETTITERDVDELVPQARSRSVFVLADAVTKGDPRAALRLGGELLLRGERLEGIIAVLGLQLRRLWQIKKLHAAGSSEAEIARAVGVQPFVVSRAMDVLPALSDERLARQLEVLSAADLEAKTASLRSQEEAVWMENLLARLCAA